jgi:hypothetical protein
MNRKKQLWRALFSFAMSFWLNLCVFLVAAAFGGKSPEPQVAQIADILMTPSGVIAGWIFEPGHVGRAVVEAFGCSLVFYTVMFWCLLTALSLMRPPRREDT